MLYAGINSPPRPRRIDSRLESYCFDLVFRDLFDTGSVECECWELVSTRNNGDGTIAWVAAASKDGGYMPSSRIATRTAIRREAR